MDFRKFSAGSVSYGEDVENTENCLPNVNFYDPKFIENKNHSDVIKLVQHLALCHTVIMDESKGEYNCSSPDELALVMAAKQFGMEFTKRDEEGVISLNVDGQI